MHFVVCRLFRSLERRTSVSLETYAAVQAAPTRIQPGSRFAILCANQAGALPARQAAPLGRPLAGHRGFTLTSTTLLAHSTGLDYLYFVNEIFVG